MNRPNTKTIKIKAEKVGLALAKELQALTGRPIRLRTATHNEWELELEFETLADYTALQAQARSYNRLTGNDLVQHLRMGFRLMASGMFQGIPVEMGGEQHRDLVRVYLVGAMCSRPADPALEALVEMVSREGWRPPAPWNWGPMDQMEAEANEDNRRAQQRRTRP